jgi:hypothetical protein
MVAQRVCLRIGAMDCGCLVRDDDAQVAESRSVNADRKEVWS